jgi:hypothetical protein
MTVKHAFEIAIKNYKVTIGDAWFTTLCWKNPDEPSSKEYEPFLVTLDGNTAIEVDRFGRFITSYSADCDGYFPYPNLERKLPEVKNEQSTKVG